MLLFPLGQLGAGQLAELGVVEEAAIVGDLALQVLDLAEGEDDRLEIHPLLVELLELVGVGEDGRGAEEVVHLLEAPAHRL